MVDWIEHEYLSIMVSVTVWFSVMFSAFTATTLNAEIIMFDGSISGTMEVTLVILRNTLMGDCEERVKVPLLSMVTSVGMDVML